MAVSIIFVRALCGELQRHGVDVRSVLHSCGVDPARLSHSWAALGEGEAFRLAHRVMKLSADRSLGLTAGARTPLHMLQLIGYSLLYAPTLRDALSALRENSDLLADDLRFSLREAGEAVHFEWRLQVDGAVARAAVEFGLLMLSRLTGQLSRSCPPREVHFGYSAPGYVPRYAEAFPCPVYFEQDCHALVFSAAALDLPQPHADSSVRREIGDAIKELRAARSERSGVADRVRTMLASARTPADVDLARLARKVRLSPHGLRRRLRAEGVSPSQLLDDARARLAYTELRRADATIKETARLFGFSATSAFHRAFKRWTGETPGQVTRGTREVSR